MRDPVARPSIRRRRRCDAALRGRRRGKAITSKAELTRSSFADALVARGEADGCVAGAVHTTADVLRAALRSSGAAAGVRTVSSAFYMVVRAPHWDA